MNRNITIGIISVLMLLVSVIFVFGSTALTVVLTGPANGGTYSFANAGAGNIKFDYVVSNNVTVTSCALWTNNSGVWQQTSVNNSPVSNGISSFILSNVPNGKTILWNVNCVDNESTSKWAASNYTTTSSANAPVLTLGDQTVLKETALSVNLTASSSDVDIGDILSYSAITTDSSKVNCIVAANMLTLIPAAGFTGTSTCNVTVTDSYLLSNSKMITATVRVPVASISYSAPHLASNYRNTTVTGSFVITNNGDYDLTGLNLNFTGSSKYNVSITGYSASLAKGASTTAAITVYVPIDQSAGDKSIGTISITSIQKTWTTDLYENVASKLKFSKVNVIVDGSSDRVYAGDTVSPKAKPQSTIKIDVEVENLFTDDEDVDIDDISVTATINRIDDGDELEDESSEFDLSAEKKKTVSFTFNVPLKVDEDTYTIEVEAEGTDDLDAKQTFKETYYIKVEKNNHELKITKALLTSEVLQCSRSTELNVEVANIGSTSEDEAVVTIISGALGISVRKETEMSSDPDDSDNIYSTIYSINVPKDFKAGIYPIEIKTYYDGDSSSDYKKVDLQIADCGTTTQQTITTQQTGTQAPVNNAADSTIDSGVEEGIVESGSFTDSPTYIALLVAMNVALVGIGAFLIWKFFFVPKP